MLNTKFIFIIRIYGLNPFPMKIYPNPATDKTFIELQNGGKQTFIRVLDRTGKLYDAT
ncbi:MAG: hypothetical protein RIS64_3906 [Bacteroidota bacterium]|jgi:hypothetical protein